MTLHARLAAALAAGALAAAMAGCGDDETSRRLGALEEKAKAAEEKSKALTLTVRELREQKAELSVEMVRLEEKLKAAQKREVDLLSEGEMLAKELAELRKAASGGETKAGEVDVKVILRLLDHSNTKIRFEAAAILRELGADKTIEPLIAIARSRLDVKTRDVAIVALGRFKDPRVEKLVMELASDPQADVRARAYEVMNGLKSPVFIETLVASVEPELRRSRANGDRPYRPLSGLCGALSKFNDVKCGRALLKVAREANRYSSASAAQSLSWQQFTKNSRCLELAPDIIKYVETEPDPGPKRFNGPKWHLIVALKRMKDARAIPVLVKMLGSENSQLRRSAAEGVEEITSDRYVPAVAKIIATAKAPNGRELGPEEMRRLLRLAGKTKDPAYSEPLLAAAKRPNDEFSFAAIESLSHCIDPEITADLIDLYMKPEYRGLRSNIGNLLRRKKYPVIEDRSTRTFKLDVARLDAMRLAALPKTSGEARAGAVVRALASKEQKVRLAAADALGRVAGKGSAPLLAEAVLRGRTDRGALLGDDALDALVGALGRTGAPCAARALLSKVKHRRASIACQAASGLSNCVDPTVAADLIKAYKSCASVKVAGFLKQALVSGAYPVKRVGESRFEVDAERLAQMTPKATPPAEGGGEDDKKAEPPGKPATDLKPF